MSETAKSVIRQYHDAIEAHLVWLVLGESVPMSDIRLIHDARDKNPTTRIAVRGEVVATFTVKFITEHA